MSILTPNTFTSYELTEEEIKQGSLLTITQKQCLQNQMSVIAEEKLALEFDTDKPNEFIQQEAYKRGQLDAFNYILSCSEAAEDQLKFEAELNSTNN